ncbi:MAG: T9SS type A sorting domain-containing protein, partial [Ekhidna sp.]|nr:T9SS type A sorting domain-containing protein [Ekhidna sp.]MBC6427190.1 T9SS type A sorting domain-containing protein [Ekhidna sp.]
DNNGNTAIQTQAVVITDAAPVPVANSLTSLTAACSLAEETVIVPTAADACDGEITATTTVAFPLTESGTITWTYTDNNGNTAIQTQAVVITACVESPLGSSDGVVEAVVYPNPAGRYVEVQSPVGSPIRILSVGGDLLLEGTTNTKVDIASLHSGLYLVQLSDGHLLKFVKK